LVAHSTKNFLIVILASTTSVPDLSILAAQQLITPLQMSGDRDGTGALKRNGVRSEWKRRGIGPICAEKFGW
jgi:hypothetical protein